MAQRGGIKRLLAGLERELGPVMFKAGEHVQDAAQGLIVAGSVSGKNHVPSAPGEPPNANLRTLDKNIETVQITPLKVEVSSNAPYSAALEFGTSKMAARPFMGPAAQMTQEEVRNIVAEGIAQATRKLI